MAYADACNARDAVDAAKRAKAIGATRKREETIREREANDRMLATLTEANSRYMRQGLAPSNPWSGLLPGVASCGR